MDARNRLLVEVLRGVVRSIASEPENDSDAADKVKIIQYIYKHPGGGDTAWAVPDHIMEEGISTLI